MRRTSSLIILLIALVMGGFAAYLANNWLKSHSAPAVRCDRDRDDCRRQFRDSFRSADRRR